MSSDSQLAFCTAEMEAAEQNITVTQSLRLRYLEAVRGLYCPWSMVSPRYRFTEYDQFRSIWTHEIWQWLYGSNPLKCHSLTDLAWKVQHERISEGGYKCTCLNFSDRNQRVYLGDGLLEYLGLLCDDVRALNGKLLSL